MDQIRVNLRDESLKQRRSLAPALRQSHSLQILDHLWKCPEIIWANDWCVYLGVKDEVQTRTLIEALWKQNKNVTLPKRLGDQYWPVLVQGDLDEQTIPGKYGLLEPKDDIPYTNAIDVWVIPGLAFDLKGNRLGYGHGYYDRMLDGQGGLKVGLAFEVQIVPEIPEKPGDILLDFVITESRIIRCQK